MRKMFDGNFGNVSKVRRNQNLRLVFDFLKVSFSLVFIFCIAFLTIGLASLGTSTVASITTGKRTQCR